MTNIDNLERQFERFDDDHAGPSGRTPARIPLPEKFTSAVGLGPIRPLQIAKADALVREANRSALPDGALTHAELVVLATPVAKAERSLTDAAKGPVEKKIAEIKEVFDQINRLNERVDRLPEIRLSGADEEKLTVDEAQAKHDELGERIDEETRGGSVKHLRVLGGRRAKAKEIVLLAVDMPIFVYAMMSLLNVNLRLAFGGDAPAIVNLVTAVIFGLLGTLLFATLMRSMGKRHRRFKGADSSLSATTPAARLRLRVEQGVMLAIIVAVAAVMGARIVTEGVDAGASPALIVPLAVMFALVVAVSGYINYQAEYENGSEETDRLSVLANQLGAHRNYVENLHMQRAARLEIAGKLCAELLRMIALTKEQAVRSVRTSVPFRTVEIARSYAANRHPVPVPPLESASMTVAEEQATKLDAHHRTLARTAVATTEEA
ncbi:hypothetical protein [Pseudoclavibacter helvolus]|uniref:hypothetical protein n=1 Tax=Pseudoclavibacter helvolus TaxID=255205 RepID=UPI0037361E01